MEIEQALKIGKGMERYTPTSMPMPDVGVTIGEILEALHTLAKSWTPNQAIATEALDPCQGCANKIDPTKPLFDCEACGKRLR